MQIEIRKPKYKLKIEIIPKMLREGRDGGQFADCSKKNDYDKSILFIVRVDIILIVIIQNHMYKGHVPKTHVNKIGKILEYLLNKISELHKI